MFVINVVVILAISLHSASRHLICLFIIQTEPYFVLTTLQNRSRIGGICRLATVVIVQKNAEAVDVERRCINGRCINRINQEYIRKFLKWNYFTT